MTLPPDELEPPLQEKDFIQERYSKNPFPFWVWLVLGALVAALLWGGLSWFQGFVTKEIKDNPFLKVTNRQISLFLWQSPSHMRAYAKNKDAYMPAFQYQNGKVCIEPGYADDFVQAPPGVIFMYHTWQRLLSKEFFQRPISAKEFEEFINFCEEWKPRNWPKAPKEYVEFMEKFPASANREDLQQLSYTTLPQEVRMAFQGWKNFYKEGVAIENLSPTYEQVDNFMKEAPNYGRNFWWNIYKKDLPNYLTEAGQQGAVSDKVPRDQLSPALRQAIYNYQQSIKGK